MTDLTSAGLALRHSPRHPDRTTTTRPAGFARYLAGALSWAWLRWRRRAIINSLRQVDDRLLRDVGIERSEIEDVVNGLIARWR